MKVCVSEWVCMVENWKTASVEAEKVFRRAEKTRCDFILKRKRWRNRESSPSDEPLFANSMSVHGRRLYKGGEKVGKKRGQRSFTAFFFFLLFFLTSFFYFFFSLLHLKKPLLLCRCYNTRTIHFNGLNQVDSKETQFSKGV